MVPRADDQVVPVLRVLVLEAAEADEGLLHFLMAVVPGLFGGGSEVVVPAVGELLSGVI